MGAANKKKEERMRAPAVKKNEEKTMMAKKNTEEITKAVINKKEEEKVKKVSKEKNVSLFKVKADSKTGKPPSNKKRKMEPLNSEKPPRKKRGRPKKAKIELEKEKKTTTVIKEIKEPPREKTIEELQKMELKKLGELLEEFMEDEDAASFMEPVDWEVLGLLHYPEVIEHPMDLGTMKTNLESKHYKTAEEFAKDMRLIWENAQTFNQTGSLIYGIAQNFERRFERRYETVTRERRYKERLQKEGNSISEARSRLYSRMDGLGRAPKRLGLVIEYLEKICPRALVRDSDDSRQLNIDLRFIFNGDILEKATFLATPPSKRGKKS